MRLVELDTSRALFASYSDYSGGDILIVIAGSVVGGVGNVRSSVCCLDVGRGGSGF